MQFTIFGFEVTIKRDKTARLVKDAAKLIGTEKDPLKDFEADSFAFGGFVGEVDPLSMEDRIHSYNLPKQLSEDEKKKLTLVD